MFKGILIGLFTLVVFTGCFSNKQPEPEKIIEIQYKVKEVYVEVPCKPSIKPHCEFKGEGYIPTIKLWECVKKQKIIIDECMGKSKVTTK